LLFVVTEDWYFWSHRLPLARTARAHGFDVALATRVSRHAERIQAEGIELIPLELRRRSVNPWREVGAIRQLLRVYRVLRPDIVHHVAMKPVLYGSIAARLFGTPRVVNALAGMGYVYSSQTFKARFLRPFISLAFRSLLDRRGSRLIVQNPDDRALLVGKGLVDARRVVLIRGSGVDTATFAAREESQGVPLVLHASRMLRDKGVFEFIEAARLLRGEGVSARFVLVGEPDPGNPASIAPATLRQAAGDAVEWWGPREDMPEVLAEANIVCLPSYREGLPKALLEAASCARAIVATDVAGCREIVRDGENGLLVPPRDPGALASAVRALAADPERRRRMGLRGRQIVETEFSEESVAQSTLQVYRDLLSEVPLQPRDQSRL